MLRGYSGDVPRLTEASRQARRDAIADAAMRVFLRRGVAHSAIADIVDELGGSAGGLYANFSNKADMIRFIAARVFASPQLVPAGDATGFASPASVLRTALRAIARDAPTQIVVQLWGEAAVDPDIHAVLLETLELVESTFRAAVLPWASTQPGHAQERAARVARSMRTTCHGYIAQVALFGETDPDAYLADLVDMFDGFGESTSDIRLR